MHHTPAADAAVVSDTVTMDAISSYITASDENLRSRNCAQIGQERRNVCHIHHISTNCCVLLCMRNSEDAKSK